MTTRTEPDLAALAAAVGTRARAVAAAVQRMEGLLPEGPAERAVPTATDRRGLALRLLRVAGHPSTDAVLRATAENAVTTGALGHLLGQDRVEVWETVGDLVQTGLVELEPERGSVRATAAGRALLDLIDRCADPEATP